MLAKVLGPMPGTSRSAARDASSPCVSMCARSAVAVRLVSPASRCGATGGRGQDGVA